jgi:hypothetical protein
VSQNPVGPWQLDTALRSVRRGVLITLAVCAAVIAVAGSGAGTPPPRAFPIVAIALGLGSVLARQASVTAAGRNRVYLALAGLLLAGAVGLLGVALVLQGGPRGIGLAYVLGGALLCLRPPVPLASRPPRSPRPPR